MAAAISWKNRCAMPGATAAWNGDAAGDPSFPASYALDPDPSKVSKTVAFSGTGWVYLTVTFPSTQTIRVLSLINARLSSLTGLNNVYAQLYNASSASLGTIDFATAAQVVPIPGTTDRYNFFALLPTDYGGVKFIRFIFYYNTAAPAQTLFHIGHPWAGPALVLPDGVDAAWEHEPIDDSPVERGPSGSLSARVLPSRLRLHCQISSIPYALAMGDSASPLSPSFRQMAREAGRSSPVLVIPSDLNAHELQTMSIYGAFPTAPSYPHRAARYFNTNFSVDEIR